jgi:hypothetical protein
MSRFPVSRCAAMTLLAALAGAGCREKAVTYYETPHEERVARAENHTADDGHDHGHAATARLEWDTPAAWVEQPASQMRLASYLYTAPDGGVADVSVFVFPDAAGGLVANVNRWRGQVGLAPVAEADLATTAEATRIAGQAAWIVDFAGTPADGGAVTRITGAIVPVSGQAWFFKMMGPDAVVRSQREAFDGMIASIRAVTPGPGVASEPRPPAVPIPPDAAMPNDAAHAGVSAGAGTAMADMTAAVPAPPTPAGFSFTAPDHWQAQATSAFRVVNFLVPDPAGGPPAQCYATPLSGSGGGELANVNRWLQQLGQPPVDDAGLARIVTAVSGPAGNFRVFDLNGADARTGQPSRIVAAILMRGDTAWFFRLAGSPDLVAANRADFDAFLRSIAFEAKTP